MLYRFPIDDVTLVLDTALVLPPTPGAAESFVFSEGAFVLDIAQVARFTIEEGKHVSLTPYPNADRSTLELYLNGSVYGAILHQRMIPPLHASCFAFQGQGIMVCGESGAGKSSLTAAFCLEGATFLTDDVTPVVFEENWPCAWSLSDRIKLWKDSLRQLNQSETELRRIEPDGEKYYFPMNSSDERLVPMHHVFALMVHDESAVQIQTVTDGIEKFTILRNAMYREEYWRAMPGNEHTYLDKFVRMSERLTVTKIKRPSHYSIMKLRDTVAQQIMAMGGTHQGNTMDGSIDKMA